MVGLISLLIIIFSMNTVSSQVLNTTQYDNFTIEWEDFNILICAVPTSVNISLFTCLPSAGYTEVADMDCLQETTVNFDQNTCQSTSTAMMYTSNTAITTGLQTSTNMATATSQAKTSAGITSYTAATVTGTRFTSISTTTSTKFTSISDTTGTNFTSISTTTSTRFTSISDTTSTTHTLTSTITQATHTSAATTTTTTTTILTTTTTSHVSTNTTTSTSGSTTTATSTSGSTTTTTSTTSGSTNATTSTSGSTNTTTSTSGSTTTATAGNMYTCPSEAYIGTYCNISSNACAMSQPCLNAATCFPNNTLPYGYYCNCQTGYTGYDCEIDSRACTQNTCWNNGTCITTNSTVASNNGSNFRCECVEGYDGVYCQLEIDLCGNITCENRGICSTVDFMWKCFCLDPSLYYGDYCQFKTSKLIIREILSKSFASIAIGVLSTTCGFILIMDILKYFFRIDPVEFQRESYRNRLAARRRARRKMKNKEPKFALRFQYVSHT